MTLDEQIRCIGREIGMRRNVYPRFVAKGTMKPEKADYELKCMETVYETLKRLKEQEGLKA